MEYQNYTHKLDLLDMEYKHKREKLDSQYKQQQSYDTLYNPPIGVNKIEFDLPFDDCVIRQLIGKEGYSGLKEILQETGVSYLWFDPHEKNMEIWGNSSCCYLAKQTIYKKIFNIINKITSNYEYVVSDFTMKWFEKKLFWKK